jgi:NDP-sugar pyrophosphorylase family protein
MSGEGARFKKAGYQTLKPLIDVDGRPILAHVLDGFPGVRKITFICNSVHLETTELPRVLRELAPAARIRAIAPHKRGPVHALQQVYDLIDDDEPVVVNYCDFAWEWDFADFAARVQGEGVDGCVLAYIGFHPHNLGPSLYAFMRARGDRVEEIREKHHFTPNKLDEYASSGTYYFRTGALLKRCCDLTVARDIAINGEYYVSSVFQTMIEDGRRVSVYPLRRFCQWGTPEDLEDYLSWSRVFRRKSEPAAARATGAGLMRVGPFPRPSSRSPAAPWSNRRRARCPRRSG